MMMTVAFRKKAHVSRVGKWVIGYRPEYVGASVRQSVWRKAWDTLLLSVGIGSILWVPLECRIQSKMNELKCCEERESQSLATIKAKRGKGGEMSCIETKL